MEHNRGAAAVLTNEEGWLHKGVSRPFLIIELVVYSRLALVARLMLYRWTLMDSRASFHQAWV